MFASYHHLPHSRWNNSKGIVPKTYDKNKMKSFPTKYKPLIGWLSKQLEYLIEFDKLHPPSAPIFKSGCPQKNTMTPMRKSRLLEIGFYNMSDQERTKILNDAKWDTQYQLLQEYIKENGNRECNKPYCIVHLLLRLF